MNINILDEIEIAKLDQVAKANGLTSEQYATNIVRGWLQSQIRGDYLDFVKVQPVKTLSNLLDTAIKKG
jgi:hypothetical protein